MSLIVEERKASIQLARRAEYLANNRSLFSLRWQYTQLYIYRGWLRLLMRWHR